MKKLNALIVVMVIAISTIEAQSKFGFFGGVGIPMGEFAATELEGDGGYAKLGSDLGLQLDFFLPSNIGFGVLMGSHRNAFDDEALGQDIITELGYKSVKTYATGTHRSFCAMPIFGYKFIDRNAFTWDIMGGVGAALNSMSQPVTLGVAKTNYFLEEVAVDYSGKYSFAYNLSTRFIYYVSPSLGLSASVGYYTSTPEYTIVRRNTQSQQQLSSKVYNTTNNIIDITVGIVFGK